MSSFVPQRNRVAFLGLLAFMLAFLLAGPAFTADNEKVMVSVVAILATDQNAKVEKKLTGIAAEVQKINPKLTGFVSAKETCKDVAINSNEKFDLVEGQIVTINVEQAANKDNKNLLKVSPPTLGDITYSTTCGKFLPIITEYKTKDGEILIIAIRVQPCRDK